MIIKENTEFGLDMIRGLPRVWYAVKNNIKHEVWVKPGLVDLYKIFTNNIIVNKSWRPNNPRDMYSFERPKWTFTEWVPPPLKEMFKDKIKFNKPTIIINNKFAGDDMSLSTVNECLDKYPNLDLSMDAITSSPDTTNISVIHYSMKFIDKLVEKFSDKYKIIYISPIFEGNYFKDHSSTVLNLKDYEYIEKNHPEVYTIKEHMKKKDISYNVAQFELEASSEKHLTLVGGNCKITSYFKGDVIIYNPSIWKYGSPKHHDGFKGERGIFKTGSWLKHLSGANIIQFNTYKDILNYINKNWL